MIYFNLLFQQSLGIYSTIQRNVITSKNPYVALIIYNIRLENCKSFECLEWGNSNRANDSSRRGDGETESRLAEAQFLCFDFSSN